MEKRICIGNRWVGKNEPVFIIAEMSANHNMDFERAKEIIKGVKEAGADAVKLQTYTADTITIDCDNDYFQITQGTLWDGTTLYKLYQKAYTPWEWQGELKEYAESMGLICFSSPFDFTAVDFLEDINVPAYKIASFEITDIPLIRKIARLGKPILISTGIAYLKDIELAMQVCREEGNDKVILLKCTSTYPSPYQDMNIETITALQSTFDCIVGLSDHSMRYTVPITAIAKGAKVIEKHVTLHRSDGGADSEFSMEMHEFKEMCEQIRIAEAALGRVSFDLTDAQKKEREHSRSLFVVSDIKKGESFSPENVRSIRPGFGLHTKYYDQIIGKTAVTDIKKGTPMSWNLIDPGEY